MGENNNDVMIAELRAIMTSVRDNMTEVVKKVDFTHSEVIGLKHQIKDVEQIRAEIDRMRDDVTDLKMRIVRYSTAASIVAVVIGWVGNAYVTQTVKDSVSKPVIASTQAGSR